MLLWLQLAFKESLHVGKTYHHSDRQNKEAQQEHDVAL
jgi:hypothetical protein